MNGAGAVKRERRPRRGAVGLAMIIVMVVLQLAVVGAVVTGARDQDLVVQRADASRAFFAAEAATNMAVRELMNGSDEDGDGAVGTISNDGNSGNDPLIGTARVYVTAATAGAQKTLTAYARSGACRRNVATVTETGSGGSGGGNTTTLAVFARNGNTTPRYSVYNGSAWGANTAFPSSIGGEATFVMCRPCPVRNEVLLVMQDDQRDVNVSSYNGSSWGSVTEICTDTGQLNYRPVDVAYEALSGTALIVYWKEASTRYVYRTWNGTALSGETVMPALSGATDARWATLFARPKSNDLILLAQYKNGSNMLAACVWSGGAWGAWTTLTSNLGTDANECYSLEFEGLSNTALAVYSESGQSQPRYRTWNGTSWSTQGSMSSIGATAQWVRLTADPSSDLILMVALDANDDLEANRWTGSSWVGNQQFESNTGGHNSRRLDLCFEPGGTGRALLLYRERKSNRPMYRVWDGSAWGSELSGPNINRKLERVQVVPGGSAGELFVACSDDANDLHLFRWNGASLSADTEIETSLGVSGSRTEPMCLVGSAGGASKPKVKSWTEAAPQ